ncbi:MAG: hypothetical protein IIA54_00525 [Chloroflexi bacterium]|nr:hypothetical protein [Chloroflexota bacterium]
MNDDSEPGIRLAVGVSGAGKTHGLRAQVYRAVRSGMPVIVLDRMHEWNEVPGDLVPVTCVVPDVAQALEYIPQGARLCVVRPSDVLTEALSACEWARDYQGVAGVACSEAHRIAPNTSATLPGPLEDVALAWRHHRVALWLDTQRISLLSRTLTEQARELRIYAVGGDRDLARLREVGGKQLEDAAKECARRLVGLGEYDDQGNQRTAPLPPEPGWHVLIRVTPLPPYHLERERNL